MYDLAGAPQQIVEVKKSTGFPSSEFWTILPNGQVYPKWSKIPRLAQTQKDVSDLCAAGIISQKLRAKSSAEVTKGTAKSIDVWDLVKLQQAILNAKGAPIVGLNVKPYFNQYEKGKIAKRHIELAMEDYKNPSAYERVYGLKPKYPYAVQIATLQSSLDGDPTTEGHSMTTLVVVGIASLALGFVGAKFLGNK